MSFEMPSVPPELAALFARRAIDANQQNPSSPMTPSSASPMRTVFGMPQGTGMFQKPAENRLPTPSDDPAILGQGGPTPEERLLVGGAQVPGALGSSSSGLPSLPDTSALTHERQKTQGIEQQIAAIHKPLPEDYKPSIWRRLLSVPISTAAGLGNPAAGAQASDSVLNGPYYRAQAQYEAKLSPLQEQLDYERQVGVPLAEEEARLGQENFNNRLNLTKEQREQTAFQNETGDRIFQETGPDKQIHYYQTTKSGEKREVPEPREQAEDRRKREEDANTPAPGARPEPDPANKGQFRVKTKAGGYIPWSPKTVEEGAMVGDLRATRLFNEEHYHPNADLNSNGYTAAEQREITTRQRPIQRQLDVLDKERQTYIRQRGFSVAIGGSGGQKAVANLDKEIDEIDVKRQTLMDKLDAIEGEVMFRRKTKTGGASTQGAQMFKVPAGAPSAKGLSDGALLRDKRTKKVLAVAKGEQWVAP